MRRGVVQTSIARHGTNTSPRPSLNFWVYMPLTLSLLTSRIEEPKLPSHGDVDNGGLLADRKTAVIDTAVVDGLSQRQSPVEF